jgi:gas vesicle protein
MDPEVSSLLSQIDNLVNSTSLNTGIPVDKLSEVQRKRAELDRRVLKYKEELIEKAEHFRNEMKREISNLQSRIASLQKEASENPRIF